MNSICKLCGTSFKRDQKHLRYCSLDCSITANKVITQLGFRKKKSEKVKSERPTKICEQCKQEFSPHASSKQKFCTRICAKAFERLLWVKRDKH